MPFVLELPDAFVVLLILLFGDVSLLNDGDMLHQPQLFVGFHLQFFAPGPKRYPQGPLRLHR